jgi:hypothetical protein
MKVIELTEVLENVAKIHVRLGAAANAKALRELANILSTSGQQDVNKVVRMILARGPSTPRPRVRRGAG